MPQNIANRERSLSQNINEDYCLVLYLGNLEFCGARPSDAASSDYRLQLLLIDFKPVIELLLTYA